MERKKIEYPVLIAQKGPLNGQRWVINKELVIGRDAACEVVIPDRQVSRFHARLVPTPIGANLEDLGSKNGTFCNGKLITEMLELQDSDMVQIAIAQHFVYLSSDATMPLESHPLAETGGEPRLTLETRSRRVWVNKSEIVPPLSVPQFSLLQALYDHPGQVLSRDELVDAIWGNDQAEGVSEQALDALVRRLRERLTQIDPSYNYITTLRGHGLRLDNPQS
jgi:hypothetical protein